MRKASSRRRHKPSSSTSTLQSEDILQFDPYSNIPSNLEYTHLSPRVAELLDRRVDFILAFLIHSLESHLEPPLLVGSPKSEFDLGVHLPEYKPTNFISPNTLIHFIPPLNHHNLLLLNNLKSPLLYIQIHSLKLKRIFILKSTSW